MCVHVDVSACVEIRAHTVALWQSVASAYIRLFYSYCVSSGGPVQLSASGQCMPQNLVGFTNLYIYAKNAPFTFKGDIALEGDGINVQQGAVFVSICTLTPEN